MSIHDADLKNRLGRFLDRKSMPRALEGKPTAINDEVSALLAALASKAPRDADALADWWPGFESRLDDLCGRSWPVAKEIKEAAGVAPRLSPLGDAAKAINDVEIEASRMNAGETVGEGWLYGRNAVRLALSGLVTKQTMDGYRSGAFLSRRRLYGEEAALHWEAEAKARHEAAKAMHRDKEASPRSVSIPDKTSKPSVSA